jgi:hypothetical protein
MNKFAVLSAAAVLGVGALASTGAEARWRGGGGGAVAAGVIGGLAAGAALGAATSDYGYARPAYGYDDGYRSVGYYDDGYAAVPAYRTRRVVRETYDYSPGYSWGGPTYRVDDDED